MYIVDSRKTGGMKDKEGRSIHVTTESPVHEQLTRTFQSSSQSKMIYLAIWKTEGKFVSHYTKIVN